MLQSVVPPEKVQNTVSVQNRHHDIAHHYIGYAGSGQFYAYFAIFGCKNLIAGQLKDLGGIFPDFLIVFD
jgi:hypothetical protein